MKKDILEEIYQKYYKSLLLFAYSLTQQMADAEDLVEETFVKAFLSYEESSGNIKNWLLVVLKHEYINEYHKKKRRIHVPIETIGDPYTSLEKIIHEERKRWMYSKIVELKEPERSVLLLKIQFDLKDEEIASYLKLSIDSVRTIRYRTKNKLAECARKEGYI